MFKCSMCSANATTSHLPSISSSSASSSIESTRTNQRSSRKASIAATVDIDVMSCADHHHHLTQRPHINIHASTPFSAATPIQSNNYFRRLSTVSTQQQASSLPRRSRNFFTPPSLVFVVVLVICLISTSINARPMATAAKCYTLPHSFTIHGADYRREHDVSRKMCAESCKTDACCLAFEWVDGQCTLKSRSLNGTVSALDGATFGICLDYDDAERERFFDHELDGAVVNVKPNIERDSCIEHCSDVEDAIIFTWRTADKFDPDSIGDCSCLGVLNGVRLSFGSVAGFLV